MSIWNIILRSDACPYNNDRRATVELAPGRYCSLLPATRDGTVCNMKDCPMKTHKGDH